MVVVVVDVEAKGLPKPPDVPSGLLANIRRSILYPSGWFSMFDMVRSLLRIISCIMAGFDMA